MSGEFLPMQLIYQGNSKQFLSRFNFSKEFHVIQTPNHWEKEETSIELLRKIIIPFVQEKHKTLSMPEDQTWLLITDVFKSQWTKGVQDIISKSNGKMKPVPT